nr:hypothetical conserved protein [uncultured Gammaproteobacteria bacterium]BAL55730.1 hypothetical conserved protein [uncultured Gammaproteobacteria bacterium]
MKIQFQEPAGDFTDGIEVIHRYHQSFFTHGAQLLALAQAIDQAGLNEERALRLAELYVFYRQAGPLHHLDEERVLFPLVVGQDLLLDGMLERLALDHEEIEEAWRVLVIAVHEVLERRQVPEKFLEQAARFERLQREHLIRENEDFLPRVEGLLASSQRRRAAAAMASMRGLKPGLT